MRGVSPARSRAGDWARRHRQAVVLNEFGVLAGAPVVDRLYWLEAVRRAAEQACLGWTHWDMPTRSASCAASTKKSGSGRAQGAARRVAHQGAAANAARHGGDRRRRWAGPAGWRSAGGAEGPVQRGEALFSTTPASLEMTSEQRERLLDGASVRLVPCDHESDAVRVLDERATVDGQDRRKMISSNCSRSSRNKPAVSPVSRAAEDGSRAATNRPLCASRTSALESWRGLPAPR
jgi:hypothetical protein